MTTTIFIIIGLVLGLIYVYSGQKPSFGRFVILAFVSILTATIVHYGFFPEMDNKTPFLLMLGIYCITGSGLELSGVRKRQAKRRENRKNFDTLLDNAIQGLTNCSLPND